MAQTSLRIRAVWSAHVLFLGNLYYTSTYLTQVWRYKLVTEAAQDFMSHTFYHTANLQCGGTCRNNCIIISTRRERFWFSCKRETDTGQHIHAVRSAPLLFTLLKRKVAKLDTCKISICNLVSVIEPGPQPLTRLTFHIEDLTWVLMFYWIY